MQNWETEDLPLHAIIMTRFRQIWNPGCYSSLTNPHRDWHKKQFQCPHGLELLLSLHPATFKAVTFQCPLGLELLLKIIVNGGDIVRFNALSGLSCYFMIWLSAEMKTLFQCPLGLELLLHDLAFCWDENVVSMPSRAWVVTEHPSADGQSDRVSMPSRAYTSFLQNWGV